MGIGSTANSTGMSMISCDNDDGGITVGSDDGDVTCYAVADSSGRFDLTGLYYGFGDGTGCTTGAAQTVYIEARKGSVGSTSNPALALVNIPPSMDNCDYIYNNSGSVFFDLSDFTNTMAAFGLAPFANWNNPSTSDGISASGTAGKTALLLAFDTINNYVPYSTGGYSGTDSNLQKQLNTISDVIATCEDSSGTGTACTDLFSYTTDNGFSGMHAPLDLWQAVASMAQDPTYNVSNELNLISTTFPWSPVDGTAPSSWTVTTSGAPVITSVSGTVSGSPSSTGGKKGTTATIVGTNLLNSSTSASPTVAVGFQAILPANVSCSVSGSTDTCTFTLPSSPAQSAMGVYMNGYVSNFMPFTITSH